MKMQGKHNDWRLCRSMVGSAPDVMHIGADKPAPMKRMLVCPPINERPTAPRGCPQSLQMRTSHAQCPTSFGQPTVLSAFVYTPRRSDITQRRTSTTNATRRLLRLFLADTLGA